MENLDVEIRSSQRKASLRRLQIVMSIMRSQISDDWLSFQWNSASYDMISKEIKSFQASAPDYSEEEKQTRYNIRRYLFTAAKSSKKPPIYSSVFSWITV